MISGVAHPPRSSERCEAILDISHPDKLLLSVDGDGSIVSAYFERVEIMRGVDPLQQSSNSQMDGNLSRRQVMNWTPI